MRCALACRCRAHVDDNATTLRQHSGHHGTGAVHHGTHVQVEHVVECGGKVALVHALPHGEATGQVHRYVNAAPMLQHLFAGVLHGLGLQQIDGQAQRAGLPVGGPTRHGLLQGRLMLCQQGHPGTCFGKVSGHTGP